MAEITEGAAPDAEVITLADGGQILVRQLLASDRDELAERYLELSPEGRRLRFFNAPDHLSARLLDYLMDVEGPDRCAVVAFALDEANTPGIAIARYVRSRDDHSAAEAAVTVLDAYQNRGVATTLLRRLTEEARSHGIATFTASVMWENRDLLDGLRAFGAEVVPCEPGVASVRIAVPELDVPVPESQLHRVLRVFAARVDEMIGLRFEH